METKHSFMGIRMENMMRMRRIALLMFAFSQFIILQTVSQSIPDMRFRRLDTRDGLSNSQVNCIMRDHNGFVWLATPYGLNRYDGYRFRHYYSYEQDTLSLLNNRVDNVMEGHDGRLWMKQGMYYTVYDPMTEKADRNPSLWLNKQGIPGSIEHAYIDNKKNYWIKTIDDGYYYFNPKTKHISHINFGYLPQEFPKEFGVENYCDSKEGMIVVSSQGDLMCIDGEKGQILWKQDYAKKTADMYAEFGVYVDKDQNIWVMPHTHNVFIYVRKEKKWYNTLSELMRARGFSDVPDEIIVWDVRYDTKGFLWVATDHLGVLLLDFKTKEWRQFTNIKGDETSLPDITNKHLYTDQLGRMWIATYKNGVAMCTEAMSNFASLAIGDINAICEDKQGYYWLGRNDGGIIKMDPKTHETLESYNKESLGLRSDIIVSAYCASDGTLYFGTYDGGLIKYRNGHWTNYLMSDPGSAFTTNNIWGVTEDKWGHLWIAVLGGGVVRMDHRTGKQRVFNDQNSKLSTIWTNNVYRAPNGWIMAGNSDYYAMINPGNFTVENGEAPQAGNTHTIASATQHGIMDSRGLLWLCSPSGVTVIDRKTGKATLLDMKTGLLGSNAVAVCEDTRHTMWVVTEHGITNITPRLRPDGIWRFTLRSYNDRDGLQPGPFNQRAICCTRDGHLLVGGQDGLDIVNTEELGGDTGNERPMFSGLLLFEQEVEVGQEIDGRVLLTKPLDVIRKLHLRYSENQFTIQMASDDGGVKNPTRFTYKLEGFNERWLFTRDINPNISYMSLPSGSYTLHVRMLNADGTMGKVESQLEIVIAAPWYRTWWAFTIYAIIAFIIWFYWEKIKSMKLAKAGVRKISQWGKAIFASAKSRLKRKPKADSKTTASTQDTDSGAEEIIDGVKDNDNDAFEEIIE